MRLDRFLETRLACSARTVRHLLAGRDIVLNGATETDGRRQISKFCRVEAGGRILQAREAIHLMMNKPRGYVSATRDSRHASVLDLVDVPCKEQLHLAGRLDFNTTGLLLLTNDGDWSSRLMLPQRKMPKTYRVQTRDAITPEYVHRFREGIHFGYEDLTTLPAELKLLSATAAELTLHEGRYHQVKRMFGFFRNPVVALHRLSVGPIVLDDTLAPGAYRRLEPAEIASVAADRPPLQPLDQAEAPVGTR